MSEGIDFVIGSPVSCEDCECGTLARVVVNPVTRSLTHLVVEPAHGRSFGRLVPIELVGSADGTVHLTCTREHFNTLEEAEETDFLSGAGGEWGYEQGQMLSFPFFGLGMGGMGGLGMGGLGATAPGTPLPRQTVTYDKVPLGEVEVRRGEHVEATDGRIGQVQGLVVDPADHHVTHFLLEEGHLWGKKQVAIPIGAVTRVEDDVVRLKLSKDEVRDLPAVDVSRG